MFGIGLPELLLILALALIVLGPEKLPQVAKQIARYMGELKKASDEFKKQLELDAIKEIRERNIWDLEREEREAQGQAAEKDDHKEQEKSDLPGGLGPEWKVARGPESQEKEEKEEKKAEEPVRKETRNSVD